MKKYNSKEEPEDLSNFKFISWVAKEYPDILDEYEEEEGRVIIYT